MEVESVAMLARGGPTRRFLRLPHLNGCHPRPVKSRTEFNKSIVDFPSIKRVSGGASTDWRPNLQRPDNPVPLLDMKKPPRVKAVCGD
jgi:hypothetical protein